MVAHSTATRNARVDEPQSLKWETHPCPAGASNLLAMGAKRKAEAKTLLETESAGYAQTQKKASSQVDREFVRTVLKSGTVADRVSALTLLVSESPLHGLPHLQTLLGMARCKGRREAVMAIESLCELAETELLPRKRRLRYFEDQPVPAGVDAAHKVSAPVLLQFAFEDALKRLYYELIGILEGLSHDTLVHMRASAIAYIVRLALASPEQSANLLALLANKLGDHERKIASKAAHSLSQIVAAQPAEKSRLVDAVSALLFRNNVGERAQYYALVFLNQILLVRGRDRAVARQLVELYLRFFAHVTALPASGGPKRVDAEKSGAEKEATDAEATKADLKLYNVDKVNPKLLAAILTGVHRAYPFAVAAAPGVDSQTAEPDRLADALLEPVFRLAHASTFVLVIQALRLLQVVSEFNESISDRFYRALYASLCDPRLLDSGKHSLYLHVLHRAIKQDTVLVRVCAFIKRLAQICAISGSVPLAAAGLFLISEALREHPGAWSLLRMAADAGEKDVAYDPKKREPRFAGAERTCLWELVSLTRHFHPTVALYARTLCAGKHVEFPSNGAYDPLKNHTLKRFLDRFAYKNPKRALPTAERYATPAAGQPRTSALADAAARLREPVNSAQFAALSEAEVPEDEQFCHRYFQLRPAAKKRRVAADDGDADPEEAGDVDAASGSGSDSEGDRLFAEGMEAAIAGAGDSGAAVESGESDDDSFLSALAQDAASVSMGSDDEGSDEQGSDDQGFDDELNEEEKKMGSARKPQEESEDDAAVFADADEYAHLIDRDD